MSPRRKVRYANNDQNVICAIAPSCDTCSVRFHALAIHTSIMTNRPVPAAIEERKKDTGITGDHHCGPTLSGMSRKREPSELWCIVESVTAAMASMMGSDFLPFARKAHAKNPNRA